MGRFLVYLLSATAGCSFASSVRVENQPISLTQKPDTVWLFDLPDLPVGDWKIADCPWHLIPTP
jgi:hypothetical protein